MKEIKAFQCDYCNKYYKHKSSAKRHENICYRNPQVKACLTCGNFDNARPTMFGGSYCDDYMKEFGTNDFNFKYGCGRWKPIEIKEYEIEEDW